MVEKYIEWLKSPCKYGSGEQTKDCCYEYGKDLKAEFGRAVIRASLPQIIAAYSLTKEERERLARFKRELLGYYGK